MNNTNPTPNLEVNALLLNLLSNAKSILGNLFVGMYLSGSLAIGDFDDDSDIDFIIILNDRVSDAQLLELQAMHVRLHNIDSKWSTCLEGYYIPQRELQHYEADTAWHLYLDNGSSELVAVQDNHKNWVFERFVLQELGIIVEGPKPQNFFSLVSPHELRQTLLAELRSWTDEILSDPESLNNRWFQSFVILSLCRTLYTFQHGTVVSKLAAVEWARKSLDPHWTSLIERAWAERPNPPLKAHMQTEPQDAEATPGFIRYVLELSRQYQKPTV
jgi:hypothetical protein